MVAIESPNCFRTNYRLSIPKKHENARNLLKQQKSRVPGYVSYEVESRSCRPFKKRRGTIIQQKEKKMKP